MYAIFSMNYMPLSKDMFFIHPVMGYAGCVPSHSQGQKFMATNKVLLTVIPVRL
jgi:hypothetical protein